MATNLTFPIGRLLWGSLYVAETKDYDGNPMVIKSGPDMGKPTQKFSFGVAIQKGTEKSWAETEWGAKIWAEVQLSWPRGEYNSPDFSWKITDGDSTSFKKGGTKPINQYAGYAGHWVITFGSTYAPSLWKIKDGARQPYQSNDFEQLVQPDFIKNGYYIQVAGSTASNQNAKNPGMYINHNQVCFMAYGEVLQGGGDPAAAGFGGALPAGATTAPVGGGFVPAQMPSAPALPGAGGMPMPPGAALPGAGGLPMPPSAPAPVAAAPALPVAAPAPAPAPAKPILVQIPGAQYTIEACRATNPPWTDEQLVSNGIARWETPSGVQPVPSFLTGPAQ